MKTDRCLRERLALHLIGAECARMRIHWNKVVEEGSRGAPARSAQLHTCLWRIQFGSKLLNDYAACERVRKQVTRAGRAARLVRKTKWYRDRKRRRARSGPTRLFPCWCGETRMEVDDYGSWPSCVGCGTV